MTMERKLAAILAADVVGYSRLMGQDDAGTLQSLKALRSDVIDPKIGEHKGRIFKATGDGVLAEFPSVVNAVACAVGIQRVMGSRNTDMPEERQIQLRIGVNLGDVIVEGDDIFGDGVNVAARLEGVAIPGGIVVSGTVRDHLGSRLDLRFEDIGEQALKNIQRPVHAFRVNSATGGGPPTEQTDSSAVAIAILPFDNMSGDSAQQYIADGITEDITTELSRFRNLSVAARHAAFHYQGKNASLAQIARELNVTYVVEGSVRKAGERIRVTAQLIDTKAGKHIWSERYDRDTHDLFEMQDEVVAAIAATLEVRLVAESAAVARRKPTENWNAYDCLLHGRELCNNSREPDAVAYFKRAVEIDPRFAWGYAWLAIAQTITFSANADVAAIEGAAEAAEKALLLDSNDPTVHWGAAMAAMWRGEFDTAGRHFDRAIALNSADTQIRADRARWLLFAGRSDEALAAIDQALKQGPFAPPWFWVVRGEILFAMKKYPEAIIAFKNVIDMRPRALLYLAAAFGHLGDSANATASLAAARSLRPEICLKSLTIGNPTDDLISGLRRSGLAG